jgi:hypothetical protein
MSDAIDYCRDEHLNRIVAKCRELLAIAEKRTPGKWETDTMARWPAIFTDEGVFVASHTQPQNAAYIADCAGPAEAAWRATIAAIEACREIRSPETGEVLDAICAAWTGEKP